MIELLLIVLVFVITFYPIFKFCAKSKHLSDVMKNIPGEKSYPIIGTSLMFYNVSRSEVFNVIKRHAKTFPTISKIQFGLFPEVFIRKAEYVEKIISASKHMDKAQGYRFIKHWLGEGLLIASGEKWFTHRKIITPTFHFTILESFCQIFTEKGNILVNKLQQHCGTNKPVNIYPYITKAALDIIAEAAMGVKLNAQEQENNAYIAAVYEFAELSILRLRQPWLGFDCIYKLTKAGKNYHKCLDVLHSFTEGVIRDRKKAAPGAVSEQNEFGKKKRLAFLDMLLETNLNDVELREEVDTFMFEGHDTTTVGISWTLFLLGLHTDIQDQVYEEIDGILQGSEGGPTLADMNEMKLLERVIKESLRLYPSVSIFGRIVSEDVKLDEYTLPAGCTVNIQAYFLHRDERFFPDPEKFDPDRFLPENTAGRHPYAYIPFSAGPRNCVGQKFAMYEEKSILSTFIRNFRFKTVGDRESVEIASEIVLRPINGISLLLEKR